MCGAQGYVQWLCEYGPRWERGGRPQQEKLLPVVLSQSESKIGTQKDIKGSPVRSPKGGFLPSVPDLRFLRKI